jgi:Endonuclease NucS
MGRRAASDVVQGLGRTSEKIRALGNEGYGASEISRFLKIRYQFAYGVLAAAGLVGAVRRGDEGDIALAGRDDTALVDEAIDQTFSLEKDLQQALRQNIGQLEIGLRIIDEGNERRVASGEIDITTKDQNDTTVAIELKARTADHKAISQLLSYMGDLIEEGCEQVRGILVAPRFTERALSAARAVPNITLSTYTFKFAFEPAKRTASS